MKNKGEMCVAEISKTLSDDEINNNNILDTTVYCFFKNIWMPEVHRTNTKINQWDNMICFVLQFDHQLPVSVNQVHAGLLLLL